MLTQPELEALYQRLEKPLFNALYRWVWDADEALDLVQEAFLRLWAMRDRVRTESVEALLWRIGTNLASNRRRRRKLWRMATLGVIGERAADGPDGEDRLIDREGRTAVRRAVLALPERLRRVVLLCEYSGLSYREVGAILGIPEGTVGSRRHTALRRLAAMLDAAEET